MNKAYPYFIALLFFIGSSELLAQKKLFNQNKKADSAEKFARWVWNPSINYFYPILDQQFNNQDQKLDIEYNNGIILGARFQKYFPNRSLDYAIEMDYQNRRLGYLTDVRYFLFDQGVAVTPIVSFKKGNYTETKHLFYEFGLRNQYIISNTSEIGYLNADGQIVKGGDIIKSYRLGGYIGIGFKNDVFNHLTTSKVARVGLKNISLGLHFPIFNQTNTFQNRKTTFQEPFTVFKNNHTSSLFFTINYTHQMDTNINEEESPYVIPFLQDSTFISDFVPPLMNASTTKKNFFGNFYAHLNYQTKVDSVFYAGGIVKNTPVNVKPTLSYKLGYTLHVLGNYKKFISESRDSGQRRLMDINGERKIRFNLFLSAGLNDQWYEIRGDMGARANFLEFESSGGLRVSSVSQKLFFSGGYSRRVVLNQKIYLPNEILEDFKLGTTTQSSYFFGVSYKSMFSVRLSYSDVQTLKENSSWKDKIGISLGFGI